MPIVTQVNRLEFERDEFQASLNNYSYVYLAEGDSWFSYGSQKLKNLLKYLALPSPSCAVNIAEPGDTLRRMEDITRNPEFFWYLKNQSGRRWSAILMSGGGNDLANAIWDEDQNTSHVLVRPDDPAVIDQTNLRSVINNDALDALLNYIKISFAEIVARRDSADSNSKDVPMLVHTYALARPRNAGVRFLAVRSGPWLYPACRWLGIAEELWLDLSRILLEELAGCLNSLVLPNFYVVDTLSKTQSIVPASLGAVGNSNDWDNEIHPNAGGYRKLAATWADRMSSLRLA